MIINDEEQKSRTGRTNERAGEQASSMIPTLILVDTRATYFTSPSTQSIELEGFVGLDLGLDWIEHTDTHEHEHSPPSHMGRPGRASLFTN